MQSPISSTQPLASVEDGRLDVRDQGHTSRALLSDVVVCATLLHVDFGRSLLCKTYLRFALELLLSLFNLELECPKLCLQPINLSLHLRDISLDDLQLLSHRVCYPLGLGGGELP